MQSILQYRTLGRGLQEQLKRHSVAKETELKTFVSRHANVITAIGSENLETRIASISNLAGQITEVGLSDIENPVPEDRAPDDPTIPRTTTTENTLTHESMTVERQGTLGTMLGQSLTGIFVRSRTADESNHKTSKTTRHVFVVGFVDARDPMNPHNWTITKRVSATLLVSLIALVAGFASSVDSPVISQAKVDFHVSDVTESLATGLFLVGWGCGAFFAAPLSETVGRNPIYIATMFLFMIFIMAAGLAKNIGSQLAFRFLAGLFASAPSTCAGGSISDMWTPIERTAVFPIYANMTFWGPIMGPVVGGFIGQAASHGGISWRWTEWVTLICSGFVLAAIVLFMPETFSPTLLKWKAEQLRSITCDGRYLSPIEVRQTKFYTRLIHNMYRPFILFATEPIVALFTLYLTIVYIVLFTFLTGYEFIFTDIFHLQQGLTFLCFLGIGVGFLVASFMIPWIYIRYKRMLTRVLKNGGTRLEPEQRLLYAIIGGPCLPIGLFWMAWTTYSSMTLWPSLVATVPIGFAMMTIFISAYQYLIDVFEMEAASALVGATFVRYVVSGGMIEVSIPMYNNIGVHWTLTVLAIISTIMAPVPLIFYRYGESIRKRSRYATNFTEESLK